MAPQPSTKLLTPSYFEPAFLNTMSVPNAASILLAAASPAALPATGTGTDTPGPDAPAKRGRGRPRIHPLPAPLPEGVEPPPKRPRGRPPKVRDLEEEAIEPPPKRGRGRPQRNPLPEAPNFTPDSPPVPPLPQTRRGRPRENPFPLGPSLPPNPPPVVPSSPWKNMFPARPSWRDFVSPVIQTGMFIEYVSPFDVLLRHEEALGGVLEFNLGLWRDHSRVQLEEVFLRDLDEEDFSMNDDSYWAIKYAKTKEGRDYPLMNSQEDIITGAQSWFDAYAMGFTDVL